MIFTAVGGAPFFERMVEELRRDGVVVHVECVLTDEEYRRPVRGPGRWWRRWLAFGYLPWRCLLYFATHRPRPGTLFLVTTAPFYLPAVVGFGARIHQVPVICLLHDLYPEALVLAGVISPDGVPATVLAALTRGVVRSSDAVVYLGRRLRDHVQREYGPARRTAVIPPGAAEEGLHMAPQKVPTGAPVRFLYSGTLGRMHDIGTLERYLAMGFPEGAEFRFQASGSGYAELRRRLGALAARAGRLNFDGPLGDREWREAMTQAEVAIVTMKPGAECVIFPSKCLSALMAGQALLAICPVESDLADIVRDYDCGWVVPPGDVDALHAAVTAAVTDRSGLQGRRRRGLDAAQAFFGSRRVAAQLGQEAAAVLAAWPKGGSTTREI
ncbi:MAG TPA: glycosyltransferase [Candidatus Didemnitutus sp.]|nr:glycosyltransferase [Candidatus Didemnitutus sp.]